MHTDTTIFLFISTGRCGTQWLATNLADLYGDEAFVTHEPLGPEYRPRRFFRAYDALEEMASLRAIAHHLARIEEILESRHYIETGWPLFAAIPLFLERFPGRVRLLHLTRHPVPTSLSHMAHQCYGGSPRDDGYTRLAALDASCPRVFQGDHDAFWDRLTPYEKCLFWWTEVHLYADELRTRYPDVPFTRFKSEDVLEGDEETMRRLTRALELPYDDELQHRTSNRVDRWNHQTELNFEWRKILDHPLSLEVAERLGYEVSDVDEARLEQRYKGAPPAEWSL